MDMVMMDDDDKVPKKEIRFKTNLDEIIFFPFKLENSFQF